MLRRLFPRDPTERLLPPFWRPPWEYKFGIVRSLRDSLADEEQALRDYRLYASRAREAGEHTTAELFDRLADNEAEHAAAITQRLREGGWL